MYCCLRRELHFSWRRLNETADCVSLAAYRRMGTVTSPKEIVAVDIDRATMASIIPRSCKPIRFKQLRARFATTHGGRGRCRPKMLLAKGMLGTHVGRLAPLRRERVHRRSHRAPGRSRG